MPAREPLRVGAPGFSLKASGRGGAVSDKIRFGSESSSWREEVGKGFGGGKGALLWGGSEAAGEIWQMEKDC